MKITRRFLLSVAAAQVVSAAALAQTQAPVTGGFPNRPITIVVPFGPGGSNDLIARAIGQELTKSLGQPVIVDNRAGGGGSVGAGHVAKSPADGYTLMLVSSTLTVNGALQPKLPFDAAKSFTPVVQVAKSPLMVVGSPKLAAKSPAELVALARANPGKLTYATAGIGTVGHLAFELFASGAGVKMVHVPYKGGALAMNDLMAGHVDVYIGTMPQVVSQVRAGNVRGIGVTSLQRVRQMPDVPSLSAVAPGFSMELWWGVFAPAGLPRDVLAVLNTAVNNALTSPALRQFMETEGATAAGGAAEPFASLVAAELQNWVQVAKQTNITLD